VTDAQLINLALTTLPTMTVVLIGILINNARLNDVKELLRAEIHVVDERVRGEIGRLEATIEKAEATMEKNHSEMLHRFGDLDTRLMRIENGLGLNRG
jgi:hypothetical protein